MDLVRHVGGDEWAFRIVARAYEILSAAPPARPQPQAPPTWEEAPDTGRIRPGVQDKDVLAKQQTVLQRATQLPVTEFPVGADARGAGLTAGSDREPPTRLVNRLWIADGGANRLSYLQFAPSAADH